MKINQITKEEVVTKVVNTQYIAEDGTIFYNEEECKKYEESALFAASKSLKRLNTKQITHGDITLDGCDDCVCEIFDIQTEQDLKNLRQYLHLRMKKNGASDTNVNDCFELGNQKGREAFVFENVTVGHEVIIFWSYDEDWFWVYRDGSIEGFLGYMKDKLLKVIGKEKSDENE